MAETSKLRNELHLCVNGENPVVIHFRNGNLSATIASDVDSFTRALAVDFSAGDNVTVGSGRKTSLQSLGHVVSVVIEGNESFSSATEGDLVRTVVPPIVHLLPCKIPNQSTPLLVK